MTLKLDSMKPVRTLSSRSAVCLYNTIARGGLLIGSAITIFGIVSAFGNYYMPKRMLKAIPHPWAYRTFGIVMGVLGLGVVGSCGSLALCPRTAFRSLETDEDEDAKKGELVRDSKGLYYIKESQFRVVQLVEEATGVYMINGKNYKPVVDE